MAALPNPFMEQQPAPAPAANPFFEAAKNPPPQPKQEVATTDQNGRKLRPNGQPYSSDPKVRYRELVEDGKIGPQFGHLSAGRSKKNRRAAEVVAEAAIEHADKIRRVFLDGIDEDQPMGVRLQAAKEILRVESEEEERALRERAQALDEMNKGELADEIITLLNDLARTSELTDEALKSSGVVVDADVVE